MKNILKEKIQKLLIVLLLIALFMIISFLFSFLINTICYDKNDNKNNTNYDTLYKEILVTFPKDEIVLDINSNNNVFMITTADNSTYYAYEINKNGKIIKKIKFANKTVNSFAITK